MSKKVSILEGQKGSKFSGVRYLRTNLSGGGVCEWVPEDSVKLTTKNITKNGEYLARSEKDSQNNPYYAFSQVKVSVKKGVNGRKDPSTGGDGNKYNIDTDDDGNLVETELPEYIKIIVPPDKLNYEEGETIDPLGMVVKAYYRDGREYGIIPIEELTLDPMIAPQGGEGSATSDLDISPFNQPLAFTNASHGKFTGNGDWEGSYHEYETSISCRCVGGDSNQASGTSRIWYDHFVMFASENPFQGRNKSGSDGWSEWVEASQYIRDGKTVFYYYGMILGGNYNTEPSTISNTWDHQGNMAAYYPCLPRIAWTLVYGDVSGGGDQTITVSWTHPKDTEALTDTFDIEITPSN